jgi:lysophospholipase L1-like esterase
MKNDRLLRARFCAILVGLGAACSNTPSQIMSPVIPVSGTGTGAAAGTGSVQQTAGTGAPVGNTAGTGSVVTGGTGAVAPTGGTGSSTTAGTGAAGATVVTAGAGGTGTSGTGAGGAGGAAGAPASAFKPKCLAKGAELALVGDSWINYVLGELLAPALASRAIADGALKQGDSYNDVATGGTSLANGGIGPLIPTQWPTAKANAMAAGTSVKFVVMDGGGNDVLLGNSICLDNGVMRDKDPTCQKTVADATMAGLMLEQKMKMDGVGQAIYFFYPHVPAGGWDVLDYSLPMAKASCEGMNDDKYQCYFVDTREAFQGAGNTGMANTALLLNDGIHPNADGEKVLADLIYKTMKDHCMGQPAASGCCTP